MRAAVMHRARAIIIFGALALCAAVAGCRSSRWVRGEDAMRAFAGDGGVYIDVPVVLQDDGESCGPACLVALLRHYGLEPDDTARRRFGDAPTGGFRAGDLEEYLRSRGFLAHLVHGTFDDRPPAGLFSLIDRRLPVIVELSVDPDAEDEDRAGTPRRHFALVVGYHSERRWVLVMDPSRGVGAIPWDRFERAWRAADHLLLVAAPDRGALVSSSP